MSQRRLHWAGSMAAQCMCASNACMHPSNSVHPSKPRVSQAGSVVVYTKFMQMDCADVSRVAAFPGQGHVQDARKGSRNKQVAVFSNALCGPHGSCGPRQLRWQGG